MKIDTTTRRALAKLLKECSWHFVHERVAIADDNHPASKECSRLQERCNRWVERLEKKDG